MSLPTPNVSVYTTNNRDSTFVVARADSPNPHYPIEATREISGLALQQASNPSALINDLKDVVRKEVEYKILQVYPDSKSHRKLATRVHYDEEKLSPNEEWLDKRVQEITALAAL